MGSEGSKKEIRRRDGKKTLKAAKKWMLNVVLMQSPEALLQKGLLTFY